jgi:hypothetical protein
MLIIGSGALMMPPRSLAQQNQAPAQVKEESP